MSTDVNSGTRNEHIPRIALERIIQIFGGIANKMLIVIKDITVIIV